MRRWVAIARLVGIGWYIAICIIVGLGGGLWLDRLLGTRLIFTLVGLILGIIVAFWGMYKMLLPVMEIEQDEDRENQ